MLRLEGFIARAVLVLVLLFVAWLLLGLVVGPQASGGLDFLLIG